MTTRPPIIGLIGGIGAGKSTVAALLESLGCLVSRSDEDARAALCDAAIIDQLVTWWGPAVLDAEGAIDRSKVAGIVFSDPVQRTRLEGLTHPWIEARRQARFAAADADVVAFVIDAPLLLEVGLDAECDAVFFVDTSRKVRLERLAASRGWSESELTRREESQLPLDVKRRSADYVIQNDGDPDALAERVRTVLNDLNNDVQSRLT